MNDERMVMQCLTKVKHRLTVKTHAPNLRRKKSPIRGCKVLLCLIQVFINLYFFLAACIVEQQFDMFF